MENKCCVVPSTCVDFSAYNSASFNEKEDARPRIWQIGRNPHTQ
jgi:hypothetical protein